MIINEQEIINSYKKNGYTVVKNLIPIELIEEVLKIYTRLIPQKPLIYTQSTHKWEEIKLDKVYKSLELANILDHVMSLENGINTKVGERGIKLSGGQQQRIGIARALYNESIVLILDEATSSLDGHTEKVIMNSILEFSGKKTIIMIAHRLKTVERCDQIFLINEGLLVDQGTYQELIERNQVFRNMASHA